MTFDLNLDSLRQNLIWLLMQSSYSQVCAGVRFLRAALNETEGSGVASAGFARHYGPARPGMTKPGISRKDPVFQATGKGPVRFHLTLIPGSGISILGAEGGFMVAGFQLLRRLGNVRQGNVQFNT